MFLVLHCNMNVESLFSCDSKVTFVTEINHICVSGFIKIHWLLRNTIIWAVFFLIYFLLVVHLEKRLGSNCFHFPRILIIISNYKLQGTFSRWKQLDLPLKLHWLPLFNLPSLEKSPFLYSSFPLPYSQSYFSIILDLLKLLKKKNLHFLGELFKHLLVSHSFILCSSKTCLNHHLSLNLQKPTTCRWNLTHRWTLWYFSGILINSHADDDLDEGGVGGSTGVSDQSEVCGSKLFSMIDRHFAVRRSEL